MKNYEKLGTFYLGRKYDFSNQRLIDEMVLYDAKDLTTHAVIIGMTGSGKTGLGIALLEEAVIDRIPIIAIDPKGDLPNLMLTFPELRAQDFEPWINARDAVNAGETVEAYAARQAQNWQDGLKQWDQEPDRIARLRQSSRITIYTPGSSTGMQVNVLKSIAAPSPEVLADRDLLRERIQSTVTGLLALMGIEAEPMISREHALLSNIFEKFWADGKGADLSTIINAIQKPPFQRIGVMDLDSFYPANERFKLAMRLNNLLASPGFEAWLEGEPLDISRFLYTDSGDPRVSIFSISHLADKERMFFVTSLLNEILAWMRRQPGTSSLRALLYMDEIFGYFPPVKNPPSKEPLLTLLKQARAFGLGVVLATQNPVDLDYKGLSNTGTWFIGRLQTERDKARVMEGLEGCGNGFDRRGMEEILAGLGKRVFLMNNVRDTEPITFQTRWVMSYLRGPVTRAQIKLLMAENKTRTTDTDFGRHTPTPGMNTSTRPDESTKLNEPPALNVNVPVYFHPTSGAGQGVIYRPSLYGWFDVFYTSKKYKVDTGQNISLAILFEDGPIPLDWDQAMDLKIIPDDLITSPVAGAEYIPFPSGTGKEKKFEKWSKKFLRTVRQNFPISIFYAPDFKISSKPGNSRGEFIAGLHQVAREERDIAVEKLRRKYHSKFKTLENRLMRAEQTIEKEAAQVRSKKVDTAMSFGSMLLGAFLGRKAVSKRSVSKLGSTVKSASRIRKEQKDVEQATERADAVRAEMAALDERLQADIERLEQSFDPQNETIEEIQVKAKSKDVALELYAVLWLPYRKDAQGGLSPDW